jgi:hypothetical protein
LSLAGLERKDVVVRKAQKLSFFSIMTHHLSFEKVVMTKRRCCHQSILLDNAHWLTRFQLSRWILYKRGLCYHKANNSIHSFALWVYERGLSCYKAMILSQKSQESWGKTTLGTLVWISKYSWLMRLLLYSIFATTEGAMLLGNEFLVLREQNQERKRYCLRK